MKKRIFAFLLLALACFSLGAQNLKDDIYNNDLAALKKKMKLLETDFSGTSILADYMETRDNTENFFDTKMFNYLIELKADVNKKNSDGFAPIHYACSYNQLDAVKLLIKNYADVNILDKDDRPPIYYAIYNENLKMIKTLVEAGCDTSPVWSQDIYSSPTKSASFNYESFTRTTNFGYKLNVCPVFQALFCSDVEILPYLIKKGFSLTQAIYNDKNSFSLAATYLSEKTFYSSQSHSYKNVPFHLFANIVTLWKATPEENKSSSFRPNIYTKFASNDMKAVKQELISTEANTLEFLPYALLSGDYGTVNLILKYNDLEINDPSFRDYTLMEWALTNNYSSAIKLLKKHGADLPKDSKYLIYAIQNDNLELVKMLVENGTEINKAFLRKDYSEEPTITEVPLTEAIKQNNLSIATYLIQKGADVNQYSPIIDSLGKTTLRNLLIRNGARTEITFTHEFGNFYIYRNTVYFSHNYKKNIDMAYLACLKGDSSELKFYLDSGVNPKRDEASSSLLFACIFGRSPDCLSLLLKKEPTMNRNIQQNIYEYSSNNTIKNAEDLLNMLIEQTSSEKDKTNYKKMLKILEKNT